MSGKPAARLGDPTQCPKKGHGPNALVSGSPDVLFEGQPAARMGDQTACGSSVVGQVIPSVLINGRPAAVIGSTGSHGDVIIGGSGTVFIGGVVSGGAISSPRENTEVGATSPSAGDISASPTAPESLALASAPGSSSPAALESKQAADEDLPYSVEEEEEEEERDLPVEQRITLRLGMFFDGTGNNLSNAALTAECRRQDLKEFGEETLSAVQKLCEAYEYKDTNADGLYDRLPGDSYGNELSNVALMYRMYRDDSDSVVEEAAKEASIPVYIDGIGTSSGDKDSFFGLAMGQGDTGVVRKVAESPQLVNAKLRRLLDENSRLVVQKIEFDVFGFSRGAAAARHFVNELLKPDGGVFFGVLNKDLPALVPEFQWSADTCINFVGLFDTVAAISSPLRGNVGVGDSRNPGVNLYLPPGCARKVLHLTAADERRHNFSLNRVDPSHEELVLPGVHSNLGGGYPAVVHERILIGRPRVFRDAYYSVETIDRPALERSWEWRARADEEQAFRRRGLPGEGWFVHHNAKIFSGPNSDAGNRKANDLLIALGLERVVRGELSRVALRVMHAKAVQHNTPFEAIDDMDPSTSIPPDLRAIAEKVIVLALAGRSVELTEAERKFLHGKYIHSSANWTSTYGFMVNKPRSGNKRAVYEDQPLKEDSA